MASNEDALLTEQIAYYRAHAGGYDRPYAEREELRELLATADDLRSPGTCWSWPAERASGPGHSLLGLAR